MKKIWPPLTDAKKIELGVRPALPRTPRDTEDLLRALRKKREERPRTKGGAPPKATPPGRLRRARDFFRRLW